MESNEKEPLHRQANFRIKLSAFTHEGAPAMLIVVIILKFLIAALLFGFGSVIVVGFIGVWLSGEMDEPIWQHVLSVIFMGALPIAGAILLLFAKFG